jgi:hypothetical protein
VDSARHTSLGYRKVVTYPDMPVLPGSTNEPAADAEARMWTLRTDLVHQVERCLGGAPESGEARRRDQVSRRRFAGLCAKRVAAPLRKGIRRSTAARPG